jgi:hypothetical protein
MWLVTGAKAIVLRGLMRWLILMMAIFSFGQMFRVPVPPDDITHGTGTCMYESTDPCSPIHQYCFSTGDKECLSTSSSHINA